MLSTLNTVENPWITEFYWLDMIILEKNLTGKFKTLGELLGDKMDLVKFYYQELEPECVVSNNMPLILVGTDKTEKLSYKNYIFDQLLLFNHYFNQQNLFFSFIIYSMR